MSRLLWKKKYTRPAAMGIPTSSGKRRRRRASKAARQARKKNR